MFRFLLLLMIGLNLAATTDSSIRLKVGESYTSQEKSIRIHFKSFHTTKTECAVPGFNCGSGYTPDPVTTPVIDFVRTNPDCKKSPLPKSCEWNYKVIKTDNKTYVDIEILNIYDHCMREENGSNRNTCILRTTVGNHFNPMHSPENCERADDPGIRNSCYEMMAENLNDSTLCKNVQGPHGRRCIQLLAIAAGDPGICEQLKKASLMESELNERQIFLDRCLAEVKKRNTIKAPQK